MSITVDLTDLKDSILKELKTELTSLLKPTGKIPLLIPQNGTSPETPDKVETDPHHEREQQNGSPSATPAPVPEALAQALTQLNSEIQSIKEELAGAGTVIKQEFEPEKPNPLTLRQSLTSVASEVQNLREELKEMKNFMTTNFTREEAQKVSPSKNFILSTKRCMKIQEPPRKLPKLDLEKLEETSSEIMTREEFQASVNQEISRIAKTDMENGQTQNAGEAKDNVISLLKESKDFYCLGVQISNLTESTLLNGEAFKEGSYEPAPLTVQAGGRESFLVKNSGSNNEKLEGVISYEMENSELRLVLYYYVHCSGNRVGVGLCPKDVAVNKELMAYMQSWERVDKIRPDKQCHRSQSVVMLENVLARGVMTWGNRSLLSVEVVKTDNEANPRRESHTRNELELAFEEKWFGSLVDGKSLAGRSLNSIVSSVRKQFGCTILFCNGLGVSMTELCWEVRSDVRRFLVPTILPKTREAFLTSDDLNMQGVFSYRIGTSDLRLALVFQVFNGGSKFAVAFVPLDVPTDFTLMKSMINPKEWRTRPDRKFSQALQGEQVVEVRNLRAKVSMTNGPKATLTVMISTL